MTTRAHQPELQWDIGQGIPSREDPPELIEQCVEFLAETYPYGAVVANPALGRRAASGVVKAQIQNRIAYARREADSERLQAAVDRLLAFVPKRAPEIPASRLNEICNEVIAETFSMFPSASGVSATVVLEDDLGTLSRHRLTVSVTLSTEAATPEGIFRLEANLQRALIRTCLPEEYQAITLVVEPAASGS